jgi:hypothetical protein
VVPFSLYYYLFSFRVAVRRGGHNYTVVVEGLGQWRREVVSFLMCRQPSLTTHFPRSLCLVPDPVISQT